MGNSPSELKSCLKTVSDHNKPTPEQLEKVWDRYDANKDGDMDSKEMATLMIALTELQKDEVKGNIEEQAKAMGMGVLQDCIRVTLLPVVRASGCGVPTFRGHACCMPGVVESRLSALVGLLLYRRFLVFTRADFVMNLLHRHFCRRSDGRDDQDDASGHLACDGPGHSRV